ncbi:MAG: DUF2934 domain-containing protein [Chloroflexi bacterium]|nr:DUF2934 domain-containing protein [Chloroflexota bacterium]
MNPEETVRRIAYQLWEQQGRPEGRALDHWLAAEQVWREQEGAATRRLASPSAPPMLSPQGGPTAAQKQRARSPRRQAR